MNYNPDIEAEVTYIPTKAGGRKLPAQSGYRPQFYYDGQDWDAGQNYPDTGQIKPGETGRVILSFLSPDQHHGRIYVGMIFLIREGTRTVGYGQVTKILDLEKSAFESKKRKMG